MAVDYKLLGQSLPSVETDTDLYTAPTGVDTVISSLLITNTNGSASSFRVAVRPAGETLEDKHYVAYDVPVASNTALSLTIGITMTATDVITVYSADPALSFSVFGMELDF